VSRVYKVGYPDAQFQVAEYKRDVSILYIPIPTWDWFKYRRLKVQILTPGDIKRGSPMKQVRLNTKPVRSGPNGRRPECPVCNTLNRLGNHFKDWGGKTARILRSGGRGYCSVCLTEFKAVTAGPPGEKRSMLQYKAKKLHNVVRDTLGSYWTANRKGDIPKLLEVKRSNE